MNVKQLIEKLQEANPQQEVRALSSEKGISEELIGVIHPLNKDLYVLLITND